MLGTTPRSVAICLLLVCSISPGLHAQETSGTQSASNPAPVYYLTQGVWITIGDKTYGFGTGTQFELVQDFGDRVRVKNGDFEFDVDRTLVTNDLAIARQAWEAEVGQQQEKARSLEKATEALNRESERQEAALAAQWQAEEQRLKLAEQQAWEGWQYSRIRAAEAQRESQLLMAAETAAEEERQAQLAAQARQAQINAKREQDTQRQIMELHQEYNIRGPSINSSGPAEQELNALKNQLHLPP